ncbi:hypothetical protein FRC09_017212, partial [Ceratobasidium sp. 395]
DVLKTESPLFTPKAEEPKAAPLDTATPVAVTAPKVEVPKTEVPKVEKPQTEAPVPTPTSEAETKLSVKNLPISSLPTFAFTSSVLIPVTKVPESAEARAATELPISKLPVFSFGSAFTPVPTPAPAASFNWAAAGMKPAGSSGDQWKCKTCDCMSPASATKCTVCEAPKPAAASASPAPAAPPAPVRASSFDWAAAGMKLPSVDTSAQWKCGACDCMSPASTNKCVVCETPKPAAPSTPAPAPKFDWGAAGMKAPVVAGTWACGVCGLSNKNASATKCEICESPR